ncbi:MAG TPA: hypothetical protein VII38_11215 [Polyangia bacterium]|jgi:hypothetical protein
MTGRRTFAHGPEGGWSAISVHLEAASGGKEGFYLTLFSDGRAPSVVFLRPAQLAHLIDLAAQTQVTDQQIWESVARIPLEPLLPSRSLSSKLRALLVDQATPIREQVRAQAEREPPASEPLEGEAPAPPSPPEHSDDRDERDPPLS